MDDALDLFLSYRAARAAEVAPLVAALKERGVRVWREVHRVDQGASIPDATREALERSRAVLAFWTDDYAESRICQH
jgi:hypothetical protein